VRCAPLPFVSLEACSSPNTSSCSVVIGVLTLFPFPSFVFSLPTLHFCIASSCSATFGGPISACQFLCYLGTQLRVLQLCSGHTCVCQKRSPFNSLHFAGQFSTHQTKKKSSRNQPRCFHPWINKPPTLNSSCLPKRIC
jgi:hypothetical protein